MPDMFLPPESDPRTYDNPVGEKATYQEYLRNYRLTLELKCQDLTPEQLATRSVPPSTMSLLGLVRHLAAVEHHWFQRVLRGSGEPWLWPSAPGSRDVDFDDAVGTAECVEQSFAAWRREVARAEEWVRDLPEAELGATAAMPRGGEVSVRDVLVHMIEEYARHCGHADLLRECIDGRTGQ